MNKSKYLLLLALSILSLFFISCQKDSTTLHVRFDKYHCDSKMYMSGYAPMWDGTESIVVNGSVCEVQLTTSGADIAVPVAAQYSAVFPSEYFADLSNMYSFVAPRFQEYKTDQNGNQLVSAPMGAYSADGNNLVFTPMGSLLKITIDNRIVSRTMVIDSLVVKASAISLWGNARVNELSSTSRNYSIEDAYSEAKGCVSLVRRTESGDRLPISLGVNLATQTAPVFYVAVPAVPSNVDNRFTVYVYAHPSGGTMTYRYEMSQSNGYSGSIPLGRMADPTFTMSSDNEQELHDIGEGLLPGHFAIGANRYVQFSSGNLQYNIDNATWQFASHQYEFLGEDANTGNESNYATSAEIRHVIDLFGYGTSGYNDCSPRYYLAQEDLYPDDNIAGTQFDWGVHNMIFNGGNQSGLWRTLTATEWNYLFANNSWGLATITIDDETEVHGIVVLPVSCNATITIGSSSGWATNEYRLTDWEVLEDCGAVFLPASGYREDYQPNYCGELAYYWSSSCGSSEGLAKACGFGPRTSRISCTDGHTYQGNSVRLCRDVVQ